MAEFGLPQNYLVDAVGMLCKWHLARNVSASVGGYMQITIVSWFVRCLVKLAIFLKNIMHAILQGTNIGYPFEFVSRAGLVETFFPPGHVHPWLCGCLRVILAYCKNVK